jgi:hypothetical protein
MIKKHKRSLDFGTSKKKHTDNNNSEEEEGSGTGNEDEDEEGTLAQQRLKKSRSSRSFDTRVDGA